ncbi:MAG: Phosphoribosyltransferase [Parcubacteria group bacterium GW2011_GWC2_42_6]|nr:MAG: Phosphoribosyltransferase [Parcubacteria group bacterium GW2011_GWC2_42_6]
MSRVRIRTAELKFSAENFNEPVPRQKFFDGKIFSRGRIPPSPLIKFLLHSAYDDLMDVMKKIKYTWRQFQRDAEKLAGLVPKDKYNCIVGISLGGVPLAALIGKIIGQKKFYTIGYHGYRGTKKQPVIKKTISYNPDLKNKKILLVDDISDTGRTFKKAYGDLSKNNKVVSAALHIKPKTAFIPDYWLHRTEKWIQYPWDYDN